MLTNLNILQNKYTPQIVEIKEQRMHTTKVANEMKPVNNAQTTDDGARLKIYEIKRAYNRVYHRHHFICMDST